MPKHNQALKVAMAAVEQLPVQLQRQLAEEVLRTVASDDLLIVPLKRLNAADNERLQKLMDKNNDGALTSAERLELERLGTIVNKMMLENSKSFARALSPELFDENGQLIEERAQLVVKSESTKRQVQKKKGAPT